MHDFQLDLCSKSPCEYIMQRYTIENANQLSVKLNAKTSKAHLHFTSISVVHISLKKFLITPYTDKMIALPVILLHRMMNVGHTDIVFAILLQEAIPQPMFSMGRCIDTMMSI